MRKNTFVKILSVLILLGLVFSYAPKMARAESTAQTVVTVEEAVLQEMQTNGTASYYLQFANTADLSPAYTMNWSDRGWFVYETLKAQMETSQAAVQAYLSNAGVEFRPFWINNSIYVKNSNATVLAGVQGFEGVEAITAPRVYHIYEPEPALNEQTMAIEPNLTVIQAPDAWAAGFNGEGYTVANIDTGVRYTHEALNASYRGKTAGGYNHNYNWYDPYSSNYQEPRDDNGHGSHTMGTMVGKTADEVNQIGVAPGANWIACRGCSTSSCYDTQLLACAEFVAAPHDLGGGNANPDLRPVAVNNSWGDCGQSYDGWYRTVVDSWVAAGVYPAFSNGNNSNCGYSSDPPLGTVGNPARYGNVSGVGSTSKSSSQYANHSNKGPTDNPDPINPVDGWEFLKPQFAAPGVGIRSSTQGSDTSYASYTGTSMSAPHVTGMIAILTQAAPCLEGEYGILEDIIMQTAFPVPHSTYNTQPNMATGFGEIRVLDAVTAAAGMCGDYIVQGTVYDDATPANTLAGAKVTLVPSDPDGYTRNVTTNAEGFYTAQVDADTYAATASLMGYLPDTATITVPEGAEDPVVQNFYLEALPAKVVTGTVYDDGVAGTLEFHGYPLMATLVFTAADHEFETISDPFTGEYSITLYEDVDYEVTVTAANIGYIPETRSLTGDFNLVQDFYLNVSAALCRAPGYVGGGVNEGFDEGLPAGWTIYNYNSQPGWHFDDPRNRGNLTGGEGIFAMVDSDAYGYGGDQNTGLRTPVLDFSASSEVILEFKSYVRRYGGQVQKVRYSTDGGTTWADILQLPDVTEQKAYNINVTDQLAGEANAMIEFHFVADWGYYWQVDDVVINHDAANCELIPGGVLAGYVYDANVPEEKIFGADVFTELNATKTAEDAFEAASGLYWFFEPTATDPQAVKITASKNQYETKEAFVDVVQSEITQHDIYLGSGMLSVAPVEIERSIFLNDDDEYQTIQVTNVGTGGATYSVSEHDMGFTPLALNIPAFTGEVEETKEAISIFRNPNPSTQGPATFQLAPNAAQYGITQAPPAFGAEVINDQLVRWDDISVPGTYVQKGTAPDQLFAADYVGTDYSTLYGYSTGTNNFLSIDTETGAATVIKNIPLPAGVAAFTGLTGAEGFLYVAGTDCGSFTKIYTLDLDGTLTEYGTMTTSGCAIDLAYVPSENAIYTVDLLSDSLHRFDLGSKTDAVVGALGASPNYAQGMDYDETNGVLYWAAYTGSAELRVIDMTTGASSLVGAFPGGTEIDSFSIEANTGGGGAVPWLDENPVEGYVAAGASMPIELTFQVRGVIEQPGDYFAQLRFKSDTPHEIQPVDVTLHVLRPYTWGNIKGTVTATEKCDINPAPMPEATVNFYRDGAIVKSTQTDENGYYSYALERGTYDVEVIMGGYVTSRVDGVVLGNSEEVVVDLYLRHDSACLTYTPESFFAQHYPDQISEQTLTFTNTGAQDAIFEISELEGEGPVPYGYAQPAASKEVVELILDDGSAEDAIGLTNGGEFLWVNRFTPNPDQFPFTLTRVETWWLANVNATDKMRIIIYQNTTGATDPASGAEFLYQQDVTATASETWVSYDLDEPVVFEGPGDVIIGLVNLETRTGIYPATIDENSAKGRSWIGIYSGNVPNPPTLPPDYMWDELTAVGFPGNFVIRGYGETGGGTPGDIPWLSEDPTAGVVFADGGSVDVTLTFDSTGLVWGDYFGALRVDNAPDPKFTIPVQLRVLPFNMMYLPLILRNFN
jgi:subtilisin family serine protease